MSPAPQRKGEYTHMPLGLVLLKRKGGIVLRPYMYVLSPSQLTKPHLTSSSSPRRGSCRFGSPWSASSFSSIAVK